MRAARAARVARPATAQAGWEVMAVAAAPGVSAGPAATGTSRVTPAAKVAKVAPEEQPGLAVRPGPRDWLAPAVPAAPVGKAEPGALELKAATGTGSEGARVRPALSGVLVVQAAKVVRPGWMAQLVMVVLVAPVGVVVLVVMGLAVWAISLPVARVVMVVPVVRPESEVPPAPAVEAWLVRRVPVVPVAPGVMPGIPVWLRAPRAIPGALVLLGVLVALVVLGALRAWGVSTVLVVPVATAGPVVLVAPALVGIAPTVVEVVWVAPEAMPGLGA